MRKKIIIFEGVRGIGQVVEHLVDALRGESEFKDKFEFLRARDFPYLRLKEAKKFSRDSLARESAFLDLRLNMVLLADRRRDSIQKHILLHRGLHSSIFFDKKNKLKLCRADELDQLFKGFYKQGVIVVFVDIPSDLAVSGRRQYEKLRRLYSAEAEKFNWKVFSVPSLNHQALKPLVKFIRTVLLS